MNNLGQKLGSIHLPYYRNIINFGFENYSLIAEQIDKIESKEREWEKVKILVNYPNYLYFISKITNRRIEDVVTVLNDFYNDLFFKETWINSLHEFESEYSDSAGDVRFNSLSLYSIIRLLSPNIVIETGVAAGKSSTIILLALFHNKNGMLTSIDLPNKKGHRLEDGSSTSTRDKNVGFLVPNYLKPRWDLKEGDSIKILPSVLKSISCIDVFFHDSLHTYIHLKKELEIINEKINKNNNAVILVDDIDMECGEAFVEYLDNNKMVGVAFRELGGVKF